MGVDGWNTGTLGMGIWNEEQNINHYFQTSPASCWTQWHIAIGSMFLWNQTLFAQSNHTRNIPLFPQWKLGRESEWGITTELQEKLHEKVMHLCNVTLDKIDRINWQGKIQDRKAIIWGSVTPFEYWNWKAQNKNKRKRQKWTMSFPISPEGGIVLQARVVKSFIASWYFRWVGTDWDTGLTAWLPAVQGLVFWITWSENDFWMFTFQTAVPFWGLSLMGPVRFSSPFSPFASQGLTVVLSAVEKMCLSKKKGPVHRTNKKKTQVWDDR